MSGVSIEACASECRGLVISYTCACNACCTYAGLSWGIYFTAYNNAKMRWQSARGESTLPAPLHLLSAAEAGCIVSALPQSLFPW